jgi:hypothetical protein
MTTEIVDMMAKDMIEKTGHLSLKKPRFLEDAKRRSN